MMLNTLSVDIDKIWLLDEPFANLDSQSINILIDKIYHFKLKNGIVIMTAHDDIGIKEDMKLKIKWEYNGSCFCDIIIVKVTIIMNKTLMPKVTASWLIDNTALTFKQIANFLSLHVIEVEQLAADVKNTVTPQNPIINGQLTEEEIKKMREVRKRRITKSKHYCRNSCKKGEKICSKSKKGKTSPVLFYGLFKIIQRQKIVQ